MIYELKEMKEEDVYLVNLRCVRSYVWFHKSKYYESIVQYMLEQTKNKWEEAVRWWVSNSIRAKREKATGFVFSLHTATYSKAELKIGYRKIKGLTDFLEAKGYIDIYKGFVKTWKVEKGKLVPEDVVPSCMIFKKRTLDLLSDANTRYNLWKDLEESDLAIIRNRETKEKMSTRGVTGFKDIKNEVKEMNEWLENTNITYKDEPIANVAYRRIFTDSVDKGGRLYTLGGGVQLLPQRVRNESLKIDGEPVVELDYNAIHPNIAYQQLLTEEGMNVREIMGEDFSPYDADLSFLKVHGKLKEEWESINQKPHNPIRSLAKLAILIGMNSNDMAGAAWTLGNKVKTDRKNPIQEQEFYALDIKDKQYIAVLEAVRKHNDLIAKKFFSDSGIYLQNIDSKIMMNIVGQMGAKGHSVLAYHDSCLVKASAENDLREAMYSAWEDVLGDKTFCKVDNK